MMRRVIVFSEPLGEIYQDGNPEGVAGDALNIAVGSSRFLKSLSKAIQSTVNVRISVFAAVGLDERGDRIVRFLEENNISTEHLARLQGLNTAAYGLVVDPNDNAKFDYKYFDRENAAMRYIFREGLEVVNKAASCFEDSTFLIVTGIGASRPLLQKDKQQLLAFVRAARTKSTTIIVDAEMRRQLWNDTKEAREMMSALFELANIVFFTWPDDKGPSGDPVFTFEDESELKAKLFEAGVNVVVIKRGERGLTLCRPNLPELEVPPPSITKCEIVDSAGAGTTLVAGTVAGLLHNLDMHASLVLGTLAAGCKLRHAGGLLRSEFVPTADVIQSVLPARTQL